MLLIKLSFIKKAFNFNFQSSKNEETTLPYEFIFVFISYFIGAILTEKSCQKHGGNSHIKGGSKPSAHYYIERLNGGPWRPELLRDLNWSGDLRPLSIPWYTYTNIFDSVH